MVHLVLILTSEIILFSFSYYKYVLFFLIAQYTGQVPSYKLPRYNGYSNFASQNGLICVVLSHVQQGI